MTTAEARFGAGPGIVAELAAVTRRLAAAGAASPALDARILMSHATGLDRAALVAARDRPLSAAEARHITDLTRRRAAREPVSRIIGRREFWSLEFRLGPAVLDPRPDSETLVQAVLDRVAGTGRDLRLLDLGTGSGCLLLALLAELPAAFGLGIDVSPAALQVAEGNARRLGLASRARFLAGDWARAVAGGFDAVVANPPYIPAAGLARLAPEVRDHEPPLALDGGADGLGAYRRILPDLARLLVPGGFAVLEHGAEQGPSVATLAREAGLTMLATHPDLAGRTRAVTLSA